MDNHDRNLETLLFLSLLNDEPKRDTNTTPSQGVDPFITFIGIILLGFGILLLTAIISG